MQTESDLRRIASLYSQVYVPERAARRLAGWIDEGKVEADAETWRQLGDLWMLARERENAKAALWKSTEIEPEPKTLEFLASIHFEDAEWERSYTAFERALDMTDPEDEDLHRLEMLTGLTAMRAGNESAARRFLARAERSEDLRGQVRSILRELDTR
jgi:tetratricopeptide (TPR) repeat protein